jgi:Fe2+ or Zn2+ uptake regulation protein
MQEKKRKDQEWHKAYEFWKDVPVIVEIEEKTFTKIVDQEFRGTILEILRKGIIDEQGLPTRHAMSASEMLPKIQEKLESEVQLTNIYFHLEKLEKAGLIREVTKRKKKEERHYVKYYGRTSKLIICGKSEDTESQKVRFLNPVYRLGETLKIDIDKQKLNEIAEAIQHRTDELYQIEKEWIKRNHETISNLDIDVLDLFVFMKEYLRGSDPVAQNLISRFYKELKFEIYDIERVN